MEALKKSLYGQKGALKKIRESTLRPVSFGIPRDWQKENIKKVEEFKLPPTFYKKFFIFSVAFFCLALAFVFFRFYRGANTVSTENIEINVLGNSFTAGGEDLPLQIQITNKNNLPLELADLLIEYPKGSSGDATEDFVRTRQSLGTVKAGETVNQNVKVVLFGEQGTTKDIKVSLEYRIAGSNAIFVKDTVHTVNISSAPVTLSVDAPDKVTSGQEITLNVKVTPNTDKVAQGMLLRVEYPPGFQSTGSQPKAISGDNVFDLGDIAAGMDKTVSIKGIIYGEDNEEKSFRFYVGEKDPKDNSSIAVAYNSYLQTVSITKPFIEAHLLVNGVDQSSYSIGSQSSSRGQISWANNLPTKITDVSITAHISGSALNKSSVKTINGFYDSSADTITWDKNTSPELASVEPGDQGTVAFDFSSLPLYGSQGSLIDSPTINVDVSISATEPSQGNVVSQINNTESKIIKVNTDLQINSKALYSTGPLQNSGPMPPQAENKTTYTIDWSVTNSSNSVSGAEARATLPFYVNYAGQTTPPNEDISYDPATKQVVWKLGTVAAGAGLTSDPREVYFQVELNPSVSQVGSVPQLLSETTLIGTDNFTGSALSASRQALNTRLSNDPGFKSGDETVVQ